MQSDLWAHEELQEWAWNPLTYINLSGSAIYGLVARDFAPLETRLRNVTSRDCCKYPASWSNPEAAIEPQPGAERFMPKPRYVKIPDWRRSSILMIVPDMDTLAAMTDQRALARRD